MFYSVKTITDSKQTESWGTFHQLSQTNQSSTTELFLPLQTLMTRMFYSSSVYRGSDPALDFSGPNSPTTCHRQRQGLRISLCFSMSMPLCVNTLSESGFIFPRLQRKSLNLLYYLTRTLYPEILLYSPVSFCKEVITNPQLLLFSHHSTP